MRRPDFAALLADVVSAAMDLGANPRDFGANERLKNARELLVREYERVQEKAGERPETSTKGMD